MALRARQRIGEVLSIGLYQLKERRVSLLDTSRQANVETCIHYYIVDTPSYLSPTSRGVCEYCGDKKDFPNNTIEDWEFNNNNSDTRDSKFKPSIRRDN